MRNMNEVNVFNDPELYRKELLGRNWIAAEKQKKLEGKSLICAFFTSYCPVGCPFCFFESPLPNQKEAECEKWEHAFTDYGIEQFISFANDANVGYLQISGGGEPFMEYKSIVRCVEEIHADRIILVTSGYWAKNKEHAEKMLEELYKAAKKNSCHPRVSIRVSVSRDHCMKLKENHVVNLITLFEQLYREEKMFTLQLKMFEDDMTLENILDKHFLGYSLNREETNGSDDKNVIKVIPWKYKLTLASGYEMIVGQSRIFQSTLRPDLNHMDQLKKSMEIFDTDLEEAQDMNSAIVKNGDGSSGLDWIVEYNGNVCTWQNRIQDHLLNVYEDDYETVYQNTMNDLITYSYIDKGSRYRTGILSEISEKTVALMKAVNIRDYVGTLAFYDEKIRLYYNIRVLQDYLAEKKADSEKLNGLSEELVQAIKMDKEELKLLYSQASYSVLHQELKRPHTKEDIQDFLTLAKLGHFELVQKDIEKAVDVYNELSEEEDQAECLEDIPDSPGLIMDRRITKRLIERKSMNGGGNVR